MSLEDLEELVLNIECESVTLDDLLELLAELQKPEGIKTQEIEETSNSVKQLSCDSTSGTADGFSVWSPEDQKLFEKALKSVPKTHGNRWDHIALLVPGKTRKDCISRFKQIRNALAKD